MKSKYSEAVTVAVESETITSNDLDEPGGTKPRLKERGRINIKEIQVEKDNWYDWKWQLKNSIRSIKDLELVLSEKGIIISDEIKEAAKVFPLAITPYYLSLIKDFSYNDPIYKMSIPSSEELLNPSFLSNDPLGEEHDCAVPNLVHRYDDRALLVSTNKCAMNCRFSLAKGTKIMMSDFSEKNIENIRIGDMVITHNGNIKRVYDVFNRKYDGEIINISALGGINIKTTQEHPFLVLKRKDILCNSGKKSVCKPNSKRCKRRHKNRITQFIPNFIDASELEVGDYLVTPRFKNSSEKYTNEKLGYLIGLYIAEGDLPKRKNGEIIGVRFSFGFHETDTLGAITKKYSDDLRLRLCTVNSYKNRSSCNVMIFDKDFIKIVMDNCGQYCHGKRLSEDLIYNSSEKFKRAMLEGMMDGDGWIKTPSKENRNTHSIEFNTVSEILSNQILMLLTHLGFCAQKYQYVEKRKEIVGQAGIATFRPIYRVRVTNKEGFDNWNNKKEANYESSKSEFFFTDKFVFNKITSIFKEETCKNDIFYDLSVEDDESYIAEKSVVHNCTRKRVTGSKDFHLTDKELDNAINYLKIHTEIKDVIISGGDPFTMPTSKLENILARLRSVKSIEIIRIGTRTPVTLPMRITDELVDMLSKYHPVWVNTHFNHPKEITDESKQAILRLVNRGIPVNNQNVLLKGINDDSSILSVLYKELLKIRVRPYYCFQCDLVKGGEHFRTPISKGIEIMENLRGRISGLGIPHFIIDSPGGKGKIPILPNYIVSREEKETILRNYKGEMITYPEPA